MLLLREINGLPHPPHPPHGGGDHERPPAHDAESELLRDDERVAAGLGECVRLSGGPRPPSAGSTDWFPSCDWRIIARDEPLPARVLAVLAAFTRLPTLMDTGRAHCEVGDRLAERFGLGDTLRAALFHVFERWDGSGLPARLRGEAILLPARIVGVAQEAEVGHRLGGAERAIELVRYRVTRGMLDPRLAEHFAARATVACARLEGPSLRRVFLDAEPGAPRMVDEDAADEALRAMGDFADLKARHTRGHSAGVAALAHAAGTAMGLTRGNVTQVERAGWVHDLGRIAVSATIWDAARPLTEAEWERVRLHPHGTERILSRCAEMAPLGELAALAHERLDGRGYNRRLPSTALTASARLLAACDVYQAMTEDRPHRPALSPGRAADELRAESRAGRLDPGAIEAVLGSAGHRVRARQPRCTRCSTASSDPNVRHSPHFPAESARLPSWCRHPWRHPGATP